MEETFSTRVMFIAVLVGVPFVTDGALFEIATAGGAVIIGVGA